MKNPLHFMAEARAEFRKISWPSRNETTLTTTMVVLMAVFFALFFALADFLIGTGLRGILSLFS